MNKKINWRRLVFDFWMLPLAIILGVFYKQVVQEVYKLFPMLVTEKTIGSLVINTIAFLVVMFLIRLYFWAQYSDVYGDSLMNKENKKWNNLSDFQQFLLLRLERWVLLIAFVILMTRT